MLMQHLLWLRIESNLEEFAPSDTPSYNPFICASKWLARGNTGRRPVRITFVVTARKGESLDPGVAVVIAVVMKILVP